MGRKVQVNTSKLVKFVGYPAVFPGYMCVGWKSWGWLAAKKIYHSIPFSTKSWGSPNQPWKMVVGRRSFPIGFWYTVEFPGGSVCFRDCSASTLLGQEKWWRPSSEIVVQHMATVPGSAGIIRAEGFLFGGCCSCKHRCCNWNPMTLNIHIISIPSMYGIFTYT